MGIIKVNIDASFCATSGFKGVASVGRDSTRAWVGASLRSTNSGTILMAEILAIRKGLLLWSNKQWSPCIIASDYLKAVNLILDNNFPNDICLHLILDCRELMSRFLSTQLQFEGRTRNTLVDALVRHARKQLRLSPRAVFLHTPLDNSSYFA